MFIGFSIGFFVAALLLIVMTIADNIMEKCNDRF